MIDGIKCNCFGLQAGLWAKNDLLDFGLLVSENTGELLSQRKTAEYNGLHFSISTSENGNDFCAFVGSLHRYKNGGGVNFDKFTFAELQTVLQELATVYHIDLTTAAIQQLEIGINIPLEYAPEIVIKNAICHKGRAFVGLYGNDRKKGKIGKICAYNDYAVKLYDKGQQCRNGVKILRFEMKIHRQRMLHPYEIKTLADLTDKRKCFRLLGLLLEHINDIIFYDFSFKGKGLSQTKFLRFQQYSNPNYWENLTKQSLLKARKKHAELIQKYNCINWRKWLYQKTTKIWFDLFDLKAEKGLLFPQIFEVLQAQKRVTFSSLDYMLEKVAQSIGGGLLLKSDKISPEIDKKNRINPATKFCIVCGRDISQQKNGSRFCSELIFGKSARQCRNKDSNKRLAIKRKIKRAMKNDFYVSVTYRHNGQTYSETLAATEINVTREWLNKVIKVTTLKEPQSTKKGKAAKKLIKEITVKNKFKNSKK